MPRKKLSLSIIIPAYNEEHHLRACLDAVAAQAEQPDEVIVVDNNSSDKTVQIAQSYPFVKVLREERRGVVFARDRGFNAVTSDLIGRIDADTILPPDWVARVKAFYADKNHARHALTGSCYFYNIRLPRFQGWLQGQVAFRFNRLLMGHYILFGSNMALPRSLWKAVKKNVCHDPDVHEDLDLAIHLHRLGYDITYRDSLRVGTKMRRVRSERGQLWRNLLWWPRTLRRHGKKTWVFGLVGATVIYLVAPFETIFEKIARLLTLPPLDE